MHDREDIEYKDQELPPTGLELIIKERERQITEEGWTAEHDDEHTYCELALAAVCYASPVTLYEKTDIGLGAGISFTDPWPESWDCEWDKRARDENGGLVPVDHLSSEKRIRDLVKAGALIAAEIDRLQREKMKR